MAPRKEADPQARLRNVSPTATRAASVHCCEQLVERLVALVEPLLHPRLEHPVALLGRVEERERHDFRAAVADVGELQGFDDHVSRHAVPLEGLDDAVLRRHLAEPSLEAVLALGSVLDEAPVSAALQLELLDDELVAAAPPLRQELRVGEGAPHAVARCIEGALDADLTVARLRDRRRVCGFRCCAHDASPLVRSRNFPRRSRRASTISWYIRIQAASASSRCGPRRHVRTRPTFAVATNPASSSTAMCFFMPVRVMSNREASSLIDASPRPSRWRMPRRVGSEIAANALSMCGVY